MVGLLGLAWYEVPTTWGAWPTKLVAGEWDNEADENVIESATLAYDFFELIQ